MASRARGLLSKAASCRCVWSIVGLMLLAPSALAHQVHVSAHVRDGMIHGEVKLGGGAPAHNAKVTAFNPAGEKIGQTTTDEKGNFSMKAQSRCDHRLVIVTGDGHGAEYLVAAAQFPENLPAGGGLEAVHHQIILLQKQLDAHDQRIRFRDVLGGIGYIAGLAGVAFYFLGVRRKQATSTRK